MSHPRRHSPPGEPQISLKTAWLNNFKLCNGYSRSDLYGRNSVVYDSMMSIDV